MIISILDFETTGLNLDTARIIEASHCIWNVKRGVPEETFSSIIRPVGGYEFEPGAKIVSKISDEDIKSKGILLEHFLYRLCDSIKRWKPVCVAGHNLIEYDRQLLSNEVFRQREYLFSVDRSLFDNALIMCLPVLDTLHHLPHAEGERRTLDALAIRHEILPLFPHRGLGDVLTTGRIISKQNWEECVRRTQTPLMSVTAFVSYDEGKLHGFHWNKARQRMERKIVASDFEMLSQKIPFEIIPLAPLPEGIKAPKITLLQANVEFAEKELAKERGFRWCYEGWVKYHSEKDMETLSYPFPSKILEVFENGELPATMGHDSYFPKASVPARIPIEGEPPYVPEGEMD